MPANDVAMFWGDGRKGESPQDFLKNTERLFKANANDEAKARALFLGIKSGGEAEIWWESLRENEKDTWPHIVLAFEARWPKKALTVRSTAEKQARLMEEVLKDEDVGQRTEVDGAEELSHVHWAHKVQQLANAIPDPTGLLIPAVRSKLPNALKDKIGNGYTTWVDFCNAVRNLSTADLLEGLAREKRLRDLEAAAAKRPSIPTSPTSAIRHAFAHTSISSPLPQQPRFGAPPSQQFLPRNPTRVTQYNAAHLANPGPPTPNNPFIAYRPGVPPQGGPPTSRFRANEERLADAQHNALPHCPATEVGRAQHAAQLADWDTRNPGGRVNEYNPYPLTPGTSAIASGECFNCGMPGHRAGMCTGQPVPERERQWRAIAATIYGRIRSSAPVNLITPQWNTNPFHPWYTSDYYPEQPYRGAYITEYEAPNQGNGSGPSI